MKPAVSIALILCCLGLLVGCQKRFTRARYETIYVGEPAAAVQDKLGRPAEQKSVTGPDGPREQWQYVQESPEYYRATIQFRDGKVVAKQWHVTRPER